MSDYKKIESHETFKGVSYIFMNYPAGLRKIQIPTNTAKNSNERINPG
jgi:hypothetical protein